MITRACKISRFGFMMLARAGYSAQPRTLPAAAACHQLHMKQQARAHAAAAAASIACQPLLPTTAHSTSISSLQVCNHHVAPWNSSLRGASPGLPTVGNLDSRFPSQGSSVHHVRVQYSTGPCPPEEDASALPAGLSSEAVAVDDSTIDAIPNDSMPAGAARTPGPDSQAGSSSSSIESSRPDSQAEVDVEAGDPRPDAAVPPSGQPGSAVDAEEPLVGEPRTQGPEMGGSPAQPQQQPEMERPNPDRIPFWGS